MQLNEIISLRDKLKSELATVEKFLEIARRNFTETGNGDAVSQVTRYRRVAPVKEKPKQQEFPISREYGAIGRSVESAIKLCPVNFSFHNIQKALDDMGTPLDEKSIRTVLRRMNGKKIRVVSEGSGRKPTIFTAK